MRPFPSLCVVPLSLALSLALSLVAFGQTPALPLPRPDFRPPAISAVGPDVPMPRVRPAAMAEPALAVPVKLVETPPPAPAPEPIEAPPRDYQTACPAVMNGEVEAKALPPIAEASQCGARSPLSLAAVSANGRMIPLNAAVTTDCGMATALAPWVADVDSYVTAHDQTRVASLIVGTNYACRNVDNGATGNLSFHALADALDVVGFTLEDGRTVSVVKGWGGTEAEGSKIIRFAHDAACTHFTTVLGPEANTLHHDHFHIDLGCHGKSCTMRLCE